MLNVYKCLTRYSPIFTCCHPFKLTLSSMVSHWQQNHGKATSTERKISKQKQKSWAVKGTMRGSWPQEDTSRTLTCSTTLYDLSFSMFHKITYQYKAHPLSCHPVSSSPIITSCHSITAYDPGSFPKGTGIWAFGSSTQGGCPDDTWTEPFIDWQIWQWAKLKKGWPHFPIREAHNLKQEGAEKRLAGQKIAEMAKLAKTSVHRKSSQ